MFQEACKTLLYGHAVVPIEIATHLKSGKNRIWSRCWYSGE